VSAAGDTVNGVILTHPDRVFWTLDGITKRDLAGYYDLVAPLMLPYVLGRPVSMLRCPGGVGELPEGVRRGRGRADACFFHKHPAGDFPGPFDRVMITESGGLAPYLIITEAGSLTALAQMGVLEIHIWGSTWPDIEHPDTLVFDLDPDPTVPWAALANGARLVRHVLQETGLASFVKTTGGKGLHVVVPITPSVGWEEVHVFCKAVADHVVGLAPDRFTASMSKAKRGGKIFIDYVRNSRGATAIAPYSTRARDRATVAVPLQWTELSGRARPDTYTVKNLSNRLRQLEREPWDGYYETGRAQALTAGMIDSLGP
jgi:bifunctional non-homologous end joining protein LigD